MINLCKFTTIEIQQNVKLHFKKDKTIWKMFAETKHIFWSNYSDLIRPEKAKSHYFREIQVGETL